MKKILITGGAGYIGSHTVVELLETGLSVVVIDNLSNSTPDVFARIKQIAGIEPEFVEADIRDEEALTSLFNKHQFDSVIHFAGLKAVGESVQQPLLYYQNNVQGALSLFKVMAEQQCFRLVFSSSATVYGDPASTPITESFPLSATNPYGQSKLMIENILNDLSRADSRWQISVLRYFNPVSAHPSGLIGENPNGIPNNLLPYIAQVAVGKLKKLSVYGNDYPTHDGTGVRDYVHVVDLARAHLKALHHLSPEHGCQAYNIGTGQGYSVLDMIAAFEAASATTIQYQVEARRSGDIATCFANADKAQQTLGWQAEHGIEQMMQDLWQWQSNNPNGYQ
ncbi:MAG: UDP-glucose 4-epimerase [Arenicella sp.]|jgi:UDP-glucose 4-epimerase